MVIVDNRRKYSTHYQTEACFSNSWNLATDRQNVSRYLRILTVLSSTSESKLNI